MHLFSSKRYDIPRVKEEVFWKNYFYRVSLIKQSAQLTALAAHQEAQCSEEKRTSVSPQLRHPEGTTTPSITVGQNAALSGKATALGLQLSSIFGVID